MVVLGLHCFKGVSLAVGSGNYSLAVVLSFSLQ